MKKVLTPSKRVQYRLFTLIGNGKAASEEELKFLAENFVLVNDHWKLKPKDIVRAHQLNPKLKITQYRNGSYAQQATEEYKEIERKLPFGIGMYLVTTLKDDVSAKSNVMNVDNAERLKPSTEAGDYSIDTHRYVSVIRIGDELMKIEAKAKADAGWQLTVKRGFWGSSPAAHKRGDRIFAQIYIGAWGEMQGWPDSKGYLGPYLRYALRIDRKDVREWITNKALEILGQGYDGVWFDITSPSWYNQGDAYGNRVTPWNFVDNEEYDNQKYYERQLGKVEYIRKVFDAKYPEGKWITINNAMTCSIEQMRGFFESSIQGASLENFVYTKDVRGWENQINKLTHAALNEYPCIAWAKWGLGDISNEQYERFAFASYLLGIRKGDKTMFGGRPLANPPLAPHYYWDIGAPVQNYAEVREYRITARTYRRDFEKGVVLVNPTETDDHGIALEKEYFDIDTEMWISKVDVPSLSGKILMKN